MTRDKAAHAEESCSCHSHEASYHKGKKEKTGYIIWLRAAVSAVLLIAGILIPEEYEIWRWALHIPAWLIIGYDIAIRMLKGLTKGKIFDENFLMTVATIGAFIIGSTAEAVAVMLLFQIGEAFQKLAVTRSRRSIAELCDIRPDTAKVLRSGREETVKAELVAVGERVIVRPGEKIPLDGRIVKGESTVNTAALTGESVPRSVSIDDTALAGTINLTGVIDIEITAPAGESVAARTLKLVEEAAERKAPMESFITKFARIYTPIVLALAVLVAVIPPLVLQNASWYDWVYTALVFLVTSCPCALVISIPLGYFAGIGGAARRGILVKGGSALDNLAQAGTAAFDKTGTLTSGELQVVKAVPADGANVETLNRCAAIAELHSNHPIAVCLRDYCGDVGYPAEKYHETPGLGVSAQFANQIIHAGSAKYLNALGITVPKASGTAVHVALDNRSIGYYLLGDTPRPEAEEIISSLHSLGIETAMLTGDAREPAELVAKKLGITHVKYGLLPEGKLDALEALMENARGKTIYIGDGINDAVALTRADTGVSMGGMSSDAAVEAADIVLMSGGISLLPEGIRRAKKTRRVIVENIIISLGFKIAVMALAAMQLAPLWIAVGADVGVSLLAVINAQRARL